MSKTTPSPKSKKKNRFEWTVFGLSAALLVGVFSVLIHQSLAVGDEPAYLLVRLGAPLVSSDQVRVPVSIINVGDNPATAVVVEISGTLAGIAQSSSMEIDYVPHRSRRKGWVSFPGEAVPADLSARILGYLDR